MLKTKTHKQYEAHTSLKPPILLSIAKASYFIYHDIAYSVARCHSDVFRQAVLQLAPHWRSHDTYAPMLNDIDDIMSRWYLLCCLRESHREMQLYTRDELVSCSQ